MSKKRGKKMSKFEFAVRWLAAWFIGLVDAVYCIVFGLPILALISAARYSGYGLLKASEGLRKFQRSKLAAPANWMFDLAMKVHPKGKKIKKGLR